MKDNIDDKTLDLLLHGSDNPAGADMACEHSEWMGEDMLYAPGIGEWKCRLQKYGYASDQYGIDSIDYRPCNKENHLDCEWYKHHIDDKSI